MIIRQTLFAMLAALLRSVSLPSASLLRRCIAIGWLCLGVGTSAQVFANAVATNTSASLPEATTAPRILVLGDSISAAYGMSLEQGWVALMADNLKADYRDLQVINASISGETTVGGLARLPALLAQHRPNLVIIELGGNDGLRGYPIKQLRNNLRDMVTLSQQSGAGVSLFPMQIPPNYGTRYTSAFSESFAHVAEQTGTALGPFILQNVALEIELMQSDGIHPTTQAQPEMAAAAEQHLRSLLGSP